MLEIKLAIEDIVKAFSDPLEANNVSLSALQDEIEDAVAYARMYLSIKSTKYRKVWYLLHVCPDAEKWPSVLLLCELIFSLPFSNGRVEQIFSSLKVIKTNNRSSLQTSTLDDLLEICIEGPLYPAFQLIMLLICGGETVVQPEEQTRRRESHIDQGHPQLPVPVVRKE